MIKRPTSGAMKSALAGLTLVGATLAGHAVASADPVEPVPTPIPGDPGPATPADGAPVAADSAAPPPPASNLSPGGIPQIQNPNYGSGGGLFGTIVDLWHQVSDPNYAADMTGMNGGMPAPPPGAGPAPPLPPGYVSTNAPGSETPVKASDPSAPRPALPPGYYPLNGPPPPGYEYQVPGAGPTAASPTTTAVPPP
jgi:hypothetical protein